MGFVRTFNCPNILRFTVFVEQVAFLFDSIALHYVRMPTSFNPLVLAGTKWGEHHPLPIKVMYKHDHMKFLPATFKCAIGAMEMGTVCHL